MKTNKLLFLCLFCLIGFMQGVIAQRIVKTITVVDPNNPTNPTKGDNLSKVIYSLSNGGRGTFTQTNGKNWVETNADGTNYFAEYQRDEWSVYMKDVNRGFLIQLDVWRKKVIIDKDGGPRRDLYDIVEASAAATTSSNQNNLSGKVSLRCDTGKYLDMCANCQTSNLTYTATVHAATNTNQLTQFTMEKQANGNYTFKTFEGKYMAMCSGCVQGVVYSDYITFHSTNPNDPWAQFQVKKLANGKYSLKCVHNNKYITRCGDCGHILDAVATHVDNDNGVWSQWDIVPINAPSGKGGK